MLMVVGVYAWINFRAPWSSLFARSQCVSVQDSCQFDVELDNSILVENPVNAILIVSSGKNMADDKLPRSRNSARVIAEVRMLEQNASVFLMNANCVLDRLRLPSLVDKCCIHVVDRTFAVASKCQRIGHVSTAIFAKVERMLALMGVFWIAIRDD
jgi:hypothetical protein